MTDAPKTGRAAADAARVEFACSTCAVWQTLGWGERCAAHREGPACVAWSRRPSSSLAAIVAERDAALVRLEAEEERFNEANDAIFAAFRAAGFPASESIEQTVERIVSERDEARATIAAERRAVHLAHALLGGPCACDDCTTVRAAAAAAAVGEER